MYAASNRIFNGRDNTVCEGYPAVTHTTSKLLPRLLFRLDHLQMFSNKNLHMHFLSPTQYFVTSPFFLKTLHELF